MSTPYHEGELAVQTRAGVQGMASRIGRSIASEMSPVLRDFLEQQTFLVVASIDPSRRVWASVLTGEPSVARTLNDSTLTVRSCIEESDPLQENLGLGAPIGLLAIDLGSRKRVRINGTIAQLGEDTFTLHVEQAYANCPKYIQKRDGEPLSTLASTATAHVGYVLSASHQALIERADTFFIATTHPHAGADASHRGGKSGFVRVLSDSRLEFPDYAGNTMFNTLGNIEATSRAGLLFLDFEHDRTLQLTGTARVVWDEERLLSHPGAERLVEFVLESLVERQAITNRTWHLREMSPYNPA